MIYKIPDKKFIEVFNNANHISDILRHFGLTNIGGNYKTAQRRAESLGLSWKALRERSLAANNKKLADRRLAKAPKASEIFVKNCPYGKSTVKRAVIKYKVLPLICDKCGNKGVWQDDPLSLQLDHINGDTTDNRISNLRWLCPNCHSQTTTYAGRKTRIKNKRNPFRLIAHNAYKKKRKCEKCGDRVCDSAKNNLCYRCSSVINRKVKRPTAKTLLRLVKEFRMKEVSRQCGVTDNAVRKWCVAYGISKDNFKPYFHNSGIAQ